MTANPPLAQFCASDLDRQYHRAVLERDQLPANPHELCATWLQQAAEAGEPEPHAMALATADADGAPSCRMVLLKGLDDAGFVFFTNYESRKGRELDGNPRAALTFWWPRLERQVRITGAIERVSPEESDAYFGSRSRGSQLAAAASAQSRPLESRTELEARMVELDRAVGGAEVARPAGWGGYRLAASAIEFWQGRPSRAHDRFLYEVGVDGWRISRLSP